jgi:tight adherence protein C
MISISIFVACACIALAVAMVIDFSKSRGMLYSRIKYLSPGSTDRSMKVKSKRIRRLPPRMSELIDHEMTEVLAMLVASLQSGEALFGSLKRLSEISKGSLAEELRITLARVELGGDISTELGALCERIPTDAVREFANKLSLAIARGTPLAESLLSLSVSLKSKQSATTLKRAGSNETKMLIPIVLLVCPVTVIFALFPSSQFLALGIT